MYITGVQELFLMWFYFRFKNIYRLLTHSSQCVWSKYI